MLAWTHMTPDIDLLNQWRDGDNEAGEVLFKRHFDSIYRFFANKVQGDIDELVQTTFLNCMRARQQFRAQSSFRTYLFTIARNELYRYLRRRQRDDARLDFSVTSLADLAVTPRTRIAGDEERQQLLRALRQLPVEQQVLLELHYWEEMTPIELAEVFDVAQATARTRLFRARAALREEMERLVDAPALSYQSVENLDAWAGQLRAKWQAKNK